jgi:catechol 2,3-dioxygenase-like lactoylglutathione lyase family enzyme
VEWVTSEKQIAMLGNQTIMPLVATADAAKARPFYEQTLGLTVKRTDPFGITFDANGVELRMSFVREIKPAPYSVLSWVVTDIAAFVPALAAKGVAFERYEGLPQDDEGIWTAPDGTKVAWFKDPDGNLLGVVQYQGSEATSAS